MIQSTIVRDVPRNPIKQRAEFLDICAEILGKQSGKFIRLLQAIIAAQVCNAISAIKRNVPEIGLLRISIQRGTNYCQEKEIPTGRHGRSLKVTKIRKSIEK